MADATDISRSEVRHKTYPTEPVLDVPLVLDVELDDPLPLVPEVLPVPVVDVPMLLDPVLDEVPVELPVPLVSDEVPPVRLFQKVVIDEPIEAMPSVVDCIVSCIQVVASPPTTTNDTT